MINYLFSDLDGTLLNSQGIVSPQTVQAVRESGLPMTLVSARAPIEMRDTIQALGLTGPQIGFNGGLIFEYCQNQVKALQAAPLDQKLALQVLEFVKTESPTVSLSCYTQTDWVTEKVDAGTRTEQQLTGQIVTPITSYTDHFRQYPAAIFKIMIMTLDKHVMATLAMALKQLVGSYASVKLSGQTYLEVTSAQAQKSHGIAFIKERYHLTTNEIAAFGDGENDLPMLRAVGLPIVMGNADSTIQQYGHRVTKRNDEDGVAYALSHLIGR
ncbi:Cof-type HAD-IIB family hydrolase [Lactiplantibacillus plantarum]|uniref:Cof-type HAD-IIB family hydrolase n=1 Tax=Lactiplantibacillus plantarum TaxID=1590 RepID=UPI0025B596BD|nr:Cof-type HAD-IIB family hydrolase [Lactiplantibacillus plantarum]MDN3984590.1 Cof-type HAD-IIB family hydrolase [Lactiplantibacillus plantarum]